MNPFKEYVANIKSNLEYGDEFDAINLAPKFRKYFRTNILVKVEVNGKPVCGKVDVSTGWKPYFVLVKSKPDKDSRIVWLDSKHKIIVIKAPGQSRYQKV